MKHLFLVGMLVSAMVGVGFAQDLSSKGLKDTSLNDDKLGPYFENNLKPYLIKCAQSTEQGNWSKEGEQPCLTSVDNAEKLERGEKELVVRNIVLRVSLNYYGGMFRVAEKANDKSTMDYCLKRLKDMKTLVSKR